MKKIITAVAMASFLSGCQLIEQLQSKGGKQQTSTLPTTSTVELPAAPAQSLDAQFERIKKGNEEVTCNGDKYLDETKKVCDLKTISDASDVYYACDGNDFQRLVAVVYQAKNILSFRSLKAYQQKPTDAQEKAIVKGLRDYPLDTIAR